MAKDIADIWLVADTDPAALAQARELFAEYAASIAGVAACSLEHQRFDDELATLPGRYAQPRGRIYLAMVHQVPVGCAALRPLNLVDPGAPTDTGEVKRMYVRPTHRGLGLGRALLDRLVADARAIGYQTLKLDTSASMVEAIGLYEAAGFVPCAPYNRDPDPDTRWFERAIG
jgi:putative acetyltransferase